MFLTPKKFAEITGENYELILELCKKGSIKAEITVGGHYKIYKSELDKFNESDSDYISREEYESVIRENERLKTFIKQLEVFISSCA